VICVDLGNAVDSLCWYPFKSFRENIQFQEVTITPHDGTQITSKIGREYLQNLALGNQERNERPHGVANSERSIEVEGHDGICSLNRSALPGLSNPRTR
jgi:hypothetical protein